LGEIKSERGKLSYGGRIGRGSGSPRDICEGIERQALRALLEKELRSIWVEILSICQKYGVSSWEGMNELIVEDKIEEGKILDDFQRVDHLTAETRRLQELLERA
jgi:hypothetical protein